VGFTRTSDDPTGGNIRAVQLDPYIRVWIKVADAIALAERMGTILPTLP
jgi:hypothetical protein